MATMKKKPMMGAKKKAVTKAAFEKSGMDNDKGVKEGSKEDKARDKKQFAAFKKKMKK